jgi:hypothetical protein
MLSQSDLCDEGTSLSSQNTDCITSPPLSPSTGVVVKQVSFSNDVQVIPSLSLHVNLSLDLRPDPLAPSLSIVEWPRCSILKSSPYDRTRRSQYLPIPFHQDGAVLSFEESLQINCGDSDFVSLASLYPQFSECSTIEDVIVLSAQFSKCEFDMLQALEAHREAPLALDPAIIAKHVAQVSSVGLYAFLQQASEAVSPMTLQPAVVATEFTSVSTFQHLSRIATHGIETTSHSSFIPNNGYNCASYDESVAHPDIIGHLLSKGHKSGRFIAIPMTLAQTCVARENLKMNIAQSFATRKRDKKIGRIVINFSDSGPNHLDKKQLLPDKFGKINSPQLGLICQLVENAHILFPRSRHRLQGLRRDIDGAFHRMRYSVLSSLLCATQVVFHGVLYAIFSTVALMGDQDVNYGFNQVTVALDEKVSDFIALQTGSSLQLSAAYVDDLIAVGDPDFLDLVHDKMGSLVGDGRAPGLCSAVSAINESKDIRGELIETLGWLFDVPLKSVHPNYLTFAKLINCFFTAVGETPFAGQRVSVRVLMVMGAHAMRAANVLTALLGHSRSFHYNIRGNCNPSSYVYLNQSTVNDIMLWRALLRLSFTDARVLRAPTYSPLLLMKASPDEPLSARGDRSISRANIWAYSDACTGTISASGSTSDSHYSGIGGYVPGLAWFGERISGLSTMCISSNVLVDTNINILELYALLTTATLAIQQLQAMQSSTGCHIHIYCDNMSAISKCRTHRSNHPVYTYLLHLLSLLQLRNRCTIGTSFLKGKDNLVADAASRTFLVPQAATIYNRYLHHLPYYKLSHDSVCIIRNQLLLPPESTTSPLIPQPIHLLPSCLPSYVPVYD